MKTKFEGVTVFIINIKSFNRGAAVTIPGVGIFVGKKHSQNIDLLRHEFGHILQLKQNGFFYFWFKIAPASLRSAFLSSKRENHIHMHTWTEYTANQLSYEYFNRPYDWDFSNFPLTND